MDLQSILKEHELNEGQAMLLGLLKKFEEKCQKFGITYYLGGGTALGAVRHRGFLPWDDDVDLYISRDNYEKLLELKDEFFDDDFVLVARDTYPSYRNVLVRMVDTNSTAVTKARIADDAPKGQFLELFILDPIPKDPDLQDEWFTKHWIYAELFAQAYKVANNRVFEYLDFKLYDEYCSRVEEEGIDAVLKELEDELFSISEDEATEYCSRWGLRNLIYDIDWFGEPRYVAFEDTFFPVPHNAERVLRFDYGDSWMYIPNVQDQITHSIASDMNISYDYYLQGYEDHIDMEKLISNYPRRKKAFINYYKASLKSMLAMQRLKEEMVKMETSIIDRDEIASLEEKKDNKGILSLFSTWYDNQCSYPFWSVRHYLDIGDDMLIHPLKAMLLTGDFSKVLKLTDWRKKNGEELSDEIRSLEEYADEIRNAYIAIDANDLGRLKEAVDRTAGYDFSSYQYDHLYLSVYYMVKTDDPNAYAEAGKLTEMYPEKGEAEVLYADCLLAAGDKEGAVEKYISAFNNTNHGLIRMHIKDVLKSIEEDQQ